MNYDYSITHYICTKECAWLNETFQDRKHGIYNSQNITQASARGSGYDSFQEKNNIN